MPLIETSTLIDDALDYAVAICQGRTVKADPMAFADGSYWVWEEVPSGRGGIDIHKSVYMRIGAPKGPGGTDKRFSPTTDWAQGGELSHKHHISIHYCIDLRDVNGKYVHAEMDTHLHHGYSRGWNAPLVAVARCYVASVAGETIEIPAPLMAS